MKEGSAEARVLPDGEARALVWRRAGGPARAEMAAVVVLAGLAFGLRVVGLDFQSLWRDEVDAVRFAQQPLADLLAFFVSPGQNGPLYYLLLRPWLAVAGTSEFALRFFSAASGVVAVPLAYRVGRQLFGGLPWLAGLGALLVATSPYLAWYGQEGKMYALVVALVLWSTERYLAALARGGWQRWLLYVVATSLAFYVHLIAALIVAAHAAGFVLQEGARRRARWRPWLASMAALILPYLPLLVWQVPLLVQGGETGYRFTPPGEMAFSLLATYGLGVVQAATPWALAPVVAVLLLSILVATEGRVWGRAWGLLVAWLVLPVAAFFGLTLLRPMFTARYLIFCLPAYLLLLAAGLVAAGRRSRPVGVALALALLALNGWGLWLQARTPLKADFRAATALVRERMAPGDLVLFQIPYGRHSFEYYWNRQEAGAERGGGPARGGGFRAFVPYVVRAGGEESYRWAEGVYTNGGMAPEEVERQMAAMTAGAARVWLVATEVALWDERGLVQAWLEANGRRSEWADLVRVSVYLYEF